VKVTVTLHCAEGASVAQVELAVKFAVELVGVPTVMEALLVLVTVRVCCVAEVPA
jgi:hypothetical protein